MAAAPVAGGGSVTELNADNGQLGADRERRQLRLCLSVGDHRGRHPCLGRQPSGQFGDGAADRMTCPMRCKFTLVSSGAPVRVMVPGERRGDSVAAAASVLVHSGVIPVLMKCLYLPPQRHGPNQRGNEADQRNCRDNRPEGREPDARYRDPVDTTPACARELLIGRVVQRGEENIFSSRTAEHTVTIWPSLNASTPKLVSVTLCCWPAASTSRSELWTLLDTCTRLKRPAKRSPS